MVFGTDLCMNKSNFTVAVGVLVFLAASVILWKELPKKGNNPRGRQHSPPVATLRCGKELSDKLNALSLKIRSTGKDAGKCAAGKDQTGCKSLVDPLTQELVDLGTDLQDPEVQKSSKQCGYFKQIPNFWNRSVTALKSSLETSPMDFQRVDKTSRSVANIPEFHYYARMLEACCLSADQPEQAQPAAPPVRSAQSVKAKR